MILFILYIAQNDSSVSMSLGSVGLSRHVLGLSGISLLLRVVSHQRAHDGITWNVNNDDGEAPRLLSLEFFKFLIFEKNVILIAYPYYSCNYKTKEGSHDRVFFIFFPKKLRIGSHRRPSWKKYNFCHIFQSYGPNSCCDTSKASS